MTDDEHFPRASDPLIADIDRRVIKLETAFADQAKTLAKIDRTLDDVLRRKTPWAQIVSGVGVLAVIIASIIGGLWGPVTSDIDRLERKTLLLEELIREVRREAAADPWNGADMRGYDKDMTEWQRRQDDEILKLWRESFRNNPDATKRTD